MIFYEKELNGISGSEDEVNDLDWSFNKAGEIGFGVFTKSHKLDTIIQL